MNLLFDFTAVFAVFLFATAVFAAFLFAFELAFALRFLLVSWLAFACFSFMLSYTSILAAGGPWALLFLFLDSKIVFAMID